MDLKIASFEGAMILRVVMKSKGEKHRPPSKKKKKNGENRWVVVAYDQASPGRAMRKRAQMVV